MKSKSFDAILALGEYLMLVTGVFQNYEFKVVHGKCCPECVEGARLFQVLPVIFLVDVIAVRMNQNESSATAWLADRGVVPK